MGKKKASKRNSEHTDDQPQNSDASPHDTYTTSKRHKTDDTIKKDAKEETKSKQGKANPLEELLWVNFNLFSVRPSKELFSTYEVWNKVPPLPNAKLHDLATIPSATACYYQKEDPLDLDYGGKVMSSIPFYHDQQDCVTWYERSDGKIYWGWGRETDDLRFCASSMAEFTTRIALENSLWDKLYKVHKDVTGHWKDFTPEEQRYISFYMPALSE